MRHASDEDLAAYVQGIAPRDPQWFRRHLSECVRCGRRLEHEARVELALLDATREPLAGVRRTESGQRPRDWRRAAWIAAAFAVLTGAWILAQRAGREPGPSTGDRVPGGAATAPEGWMYDPESPGATDLEVLPPGHDVVAPDDYCRDIHPDRAASS